MDMTAFNQRFSFLAGNPLFLLGANLMAGSGPSLTPINTGQVVGNAFNNMAQQMAQQRQMQQMAQMRALQAKALEDKLKREQAQQAAMQQLAKGSPDVSAALTAFPELGKDLLKSKLIPPEWQRRYEWMLQHPEEAARLKALGAMGGTNVTVQNVGEREFEKQFGKISADEYKRILEAAREEQDRANKYQMINNLLEGAYTGFGGKAIMQVQKAARLLGIDFKDMGIDVGAIGPKEAANTVMSQLALQLRSTASGAGMPGQMSDQDRQFLLSIPPGLEMTPQGRDLLAKVQQRLAKRAQEVLKMARMYRVKHKGAFNADEFALMANEYAQQHPLFADLADQFNQKPSQAAEPTASPKLEEDPTIQKALEIINESK